MELWNVHKAGLIGCGGFWQQAFWLSHMWFPWQLHTYSFKGAWAGCHWQPFPHWNPSVRNNRKHCGRRKRRGRSMVVLSLSEVHQTKIIKKGIFERLWARRRGSCSLTEGAVHHVWNTRIFFGPKPLIVTLRSPTAFLRTGASLNVRWLCLKGRKHDTRQHVLSNNAYLSCVEMLQL